MENIAAAATQTAVKGGPLAQLAASLKISVNAVARQQQEIALLYKQANALKKIGTQAASIGTVTGGTTVCKNCEAVGRTAQHMKNTCYFDPRKLTDRKEWARKLMDKKGVA